MTLKSKSVGHDIYTIADALLSFHMVSALYIIKIIHVAPTTDSNSLDHEDKIAELHLMYLSRQWKGRRKICCLLDPSPIYPEDIYAREGCWF